MGDDHSGYDGKSTSTAKQSSTEPATVAVYDWVYSLTFSTITRPRARGQGSLGRRRSRCCVPHDCGMLAREGVAMPVRTIEWRNGRVVMIDQRLLPTREVYRVYSDYREVARAIKDMVIRGAPAIGVAAAMGIALGVRGLKRDELRREFDKICRTFAATRPTAVNLFWAIERMRRVYAQNDTRDVGTLGLMLEREARTIHEEDIAANRALGAHGAALIEDGSTILTHCNAGALATAGYGTALGVMRAAVEANKRISVYCSET